jgi:HK97 family phage prohead protease
MKETDREQKDFAIEVKEDEGVGAAKGAFVGLASVYGNVDLGGDIVLAGAFTKTIRANKGRVSVLWQHDSYTPVGLGVVEDTDKGLVIRGQIKLDDDIPESKKAYACLHHGLVKGLSIGYRTVEADYDRATGIRSIKELDLLEVSLVTIPMNPKARIQSVKGDDPDAVAAWLESAVRMCKGGDARIKVLFGELQAAAQVVKSNKQDADDLIAAMRDAWTKK